MAQDIKAMAEAIGYNPSESFWGKTESQQRSMIRAKELEYARRDARNVLADFLEDDLFNGLPESIQNALRTVAEKRVGGGFGGGGGGQRNVFMDTLKSYLVKVGDQVDELELFKSLKMGRGEIRAKIRENLKKADPKDRFWVQLDESAEAWVLIGVGAKQPKKWSGAPIDEPTDK